MAFASCAVCASRAAAQPSGFVYTLIGTGSTNLVYGATLDASGSLTILPGYPISTGQPSGTGNSEDLVYDATNHRLYALNNIAQNLSAWSVDTTTGALTPLPFSPIVIPQPFGGSCIAIDPSGSILAVGGLDKVATFFITGTSATPAPGSPFDAGFAPSASCAFSRNGAYFYTGGANFFVLAGFSVNQTTGALATLPGSPFLAGPSPRAYQTDNLGHLFSTQQPIGSSTTPQMFSTTNGVPSGGTTAANTQTFVLHGALYPAGYYLTTGSGVGVFRIGPDPAVPSLTAVAGSPFASGMFGQVSVVNTTGSLVVAGDGVSNRNQTVFSFNQSTGAMTQILVTPVNSLGTTGGIHGMVFVPTTALPPPTPTPPIPPTISGIPDQTMAINTSATVPFTIGGDLLPTALRLTLASSNPVLLPVSPSTLSTSCDISGACTLRITPEDGRAGSSVIIVSVSDGFSVTSTSFTVTVTGATTQPTTPGVVLANAVGSGIAITWTTPGSGAPSYYAIAWGTAPGAANLPLQLVPGTSGRLDIPAVPPGTYFFRVYAVGSVDLSPPSRETSATVASSPSIPGPPMAEQAIGGAGNLTAGWNAPIIGGTPTLYEVQIGSEPGASDVADVTTADRLLTRSVSAGNYWVQTRAASGGATGAFSSSVQIPVAPPACSGPPAAPVLLPVTTTPGQVTFTWVTAGPATGYQVQIAQGGTLLTTVASVGAGTSAVWNATAAASARVTTANACGTSASSNQVSFVVP